MGATGCKGQRLDGPGASLEAQVASPKAFHCLNRSKQTLFRSVHPTPKVSHKKVALVKTDRERMLTNKYPVTRKLAVIRYGKLLLSKPHLSHFTTYKENLMEFI